MATIDVYNGISEEYAKKAVSNEQFTNAMKAAEETAKMSADDYDFSRRFVQRALKTDPELSADAMRVLIKKVPALAGKRVDQLPANIKALYSKIVETGKINREYALNYCFLKCLPIVNSSFSRFAKVARSLRTHEGSDIYSEYATEAYLKFMYMMQGDYFMKTDIPAGATKIGGSFNFEKVKTKIEKEKASNKSKNSKYDFFDALRGRFYQELLNTGRDMLYTASNDGAAGQQKTYTDEEGKTRVKRSALGNISLDSEAISSKDSSDFSLEDKITSEYINNSGKISDNDAYNEADAFMDKWRDCCEDTQNTFDGITSRWEVKAYTRDGKEKPNRKAKAFKFLIINAVGQGGLTSSADMAKAIYSDQAKPSEWWATDIMGTGNPNYKEASVMTILKDYGITMEGIINACNKVGIEKVLAPLDGIGSPLPQNEVVQKITAIGKGLSKGRDILNETKESMEIERLSKVKLVEEFFRDRIAV